MIRGWLSAAAFVVALTFQSATAQVPGFAPLMGLPASGGGGVTTTFDPAKKGVEIVLSGGNLVMTGGVDDMSGLSTNGITAGHKIYWEITVNTAAHGYTPWVGVANVSAPLTTFFSADANSLGYFANAGVGGSATATLQTFTTGAIIGQAVDFDNGKMWFTLDGTNWNVGAGGTQDPATNQGGLAIPTGTVYPGAGMDTVAQVTANFGATSFTYTKPTGFTTLP